MRNCTPSSGAGSTPDGNYSKTNYNEKITSSTSTVAKAYKKDEQILQKWNTH